MPRLSGFADLGLRTPAPERDPEPTYRTTGDWLRAVHETTQGKAAPATRALFSPPMPVRDSRAELRALEQQRMDWEERKRVEAERPIRERVMGEVQSRIDDSERRAADAEQRLTEFLQRQAAAEAAAPRADTPRKPMGPHEVNVIRRDGNGFVRTLTIRPREDGNGRRLNVEVLRSDGNGQAQQLVITPETEH